MKKLLTRMSPLAPDDSGACSVLYELGGITVICDAGGCAGNVCGFDEPRWFTKRSALFSAGLRDMDAILGRDDMLVKKLKAVCEQVSGEFTAIIGTPVPAVIATDMHALERMSEKQTGMPCIAIDTDGTSFYDKGEEKAYLRIFGTFTEEEHQPDPHKLGIIGATPLDLGIITADALRIAARKEQFTEIVTFGMDSDINEIRKAATCAEILCISPAAVPAAKLLKKKFGTPYTVGFPLIPQSIVRQAADLRAERALIIHQQFAANAVRDALPETDSVTVASWFTMLPDYMQESDFHIRDEEMLIQEAEKYDLIIADSVLKRVLRNYKGKWIDYPHFAVSGKLVSEDFYADT
ncbi:MAG: hypothetical protein IK130_06940 [Oscillospiraceae bacterium]|nr:hypothetical protein [Oscillospiraceae bacterium]